LLTQQPMIEKRAGNLKNTSCQKFQILSGAFTRGTPLSQTNAWAVTQTILSQFHAVSEGFVAVSSARQVSTGIKVVPGPLRTVTTSFGIVNSASQGGEEPTLPFVSAMPPSVQVRLPILRLLLATKSALPRDSNALLFPSPCAWRWTCKVA